MALFGDISVSPPSWQQLERPRKRRTDTDGGKIAAIRRQHAVDVPAFSYSDDCSIDESQVELRESGVEFEGTVDSSLEISEELRFMAEFVVRRLEEVCRGRAAARVVAGRHHP